ncbi:MAG TPA: LAGLIDADG family homing endonuclease [Gemmataceae bacterium]|nr:LAGLIDADG family homing endonuclease [Gemmataceae bacterium]
MVSTGKALIASLRQQQNLSDYRKTHWEGSFEEYLDIVAEHPEITRTAYQRLYDMILSHGTDEVFENKEKIIRYKFFTEYAAKHGDGIFGIDRPLMQLVHAFKSAAKGYGTERRVLLLHGPVGSAKSTIARLLKRGLEDYSRTDAGMLFSFAWKGRDGAPAQKCPMHEDALNLVPHDLRTGLLAKLNASHKTGDIEVTIRGDLCPFCRQMFNERLAQHDGDWGRMLEDIKVYRLLMSEQDRIGIGTFQPKDEKNQDSTELTGDINYRKIAEYGTDSDPRCLAAETLIATGEGLAEMGDLLPSEPAPDTFVPRPLAVSTIGQPRIGLADSVYHGGKHPLFCVKTRLGYRLRGTPNHMVLTMTPEGEPAWKELRLLQAGDWVALGRGIHTWATEDVAFPTWEHTWYGNERQHPRFPECLTPQLAYFLGLWIGDGHFFVKPEENVYELGWTQKETDRQAMFAELLAELFGVQARITCPRDHAGCVLVGSRALVSWLREVVGLKDGARAKAIPDCILRSTRESLRVCLQGLWETDGTIRSNGSNWAMFATCSEVLARQVQTVLLAFGIVSLLKKCPSDWEVRLYGQNVNRLVELLPSLKERFTVGSECFAKPAPNVDVVPFLKPRLRALYQRAHNRDELKRRFSGNLHDAHKRNVSYELLGDFLAAVQPSEDLQKDIVNLRHLLDMRYVWLPVESIEPDGEARVYDVSVARTHAYWADGFIAHNCFNFDGELNIANRGLVEFIEVLKLDVAFLYDLLGASQEHKIKPKKFAQTDIDEVILGHTNEPEYKRLQNNEFMEALRDRTVKIDIPYVTRLKDEIRIYEKDFNPQRVKGKHIAPHTIEIAAMWAVLTRLVPPKHANLTLLQKLKLYNGKTLPGFTEDNVTELKREAVNEGMHGISPRYIQDKISNAIVAHPDEDSVNPFMVIHELEAGLRHHSLITSQEQAQHYRELISVVKEEYEDIVKNEVQRAIAADEDALARLCSNYIDNVRAYTQREKVRNKYTGNYEEPDERLMRSVEEKIDIPDGRKDDFRREIMNYIGALALDGKRFDYKTNDRLQKALELKLFEDQKDTIKLTSLVSNVVDKATQEKIDVVKSRLIRNYGYNESSATDVLTFVASIFARGHTKK